ncbi:hypothetical protein, partial [Streptomyces sp. CC224B]|uniref:hypothetical protein n=1 Tax=Streptomyces sp. CC224B TaxID=3044571 RepID=UPI0032C0D391
MTRRRHTSAQEYQGAALAREAEGYLLLESERQQARREAEALCASLPWLTTGQAEDLTHHYTRHRLVLTRQMLRGTVERAAQLRDEYEARYAALRRTLLIRHTVSAAAMTCTAALAGTVTCLLTR